MLSGSRVHGHAVAMRRSGVLSHHSAKRRLESHIGAKSDSGSLRDRDGQVRSLSSMLSTID